MNHSMINAMMSMRGLQQKLDVMANNIANVNTAGYKRKDASFEELLTGIQDQTEQFQQEGRMTPLGLSLGFGSRLGVQTIDFTQGSLQQTGRDLDVAIEGSGMLELSVAALDEEGDVIFRTGYTRNGALQLAQTEDGAVLADANGHYVMGIDGDPIVVPDNYKIAIDAYGEVIAYRDDSTEIPDVIGQIKIVHVDKPNELQPVGENLYTVPMDPELDEPIEGIVSEAEESDLDQQEWMEAYGISVRQGFIEQSNVDLTQEMTDVIAVQRAYQMNARALASSDNLMSLANSLRG